MRRIDDYTPEEADVLDRDEFHAQYEAVKALIEEAEPITK